MMTSKALLHTMRLSKKRKKLTFNDLSRMVAGITGRPVTRQYCESLMSGRINPPQYKTIVLDALKQILL